MIEQQQQQPTTSNDLHKQPPQNVTITNATVIGSQAAEPPLNNNNNNNNNIQDAVNQTHISSSRNRHFHNQIQQQQLSLSSSTSLASSIASSSSFSSSAPSPPNTPTLALTTTASTITTTLTASINTAATNLTSLLSNHHQKQQQHQHITSTKAADHAILPSDSNINNNDNDNVPLVVSNNNITAAVALSEDQSNESNCLSSSISNDASLAEATKLGFEVKEVANINKNKTNIVDDERGGNAKPSDIHDHNPEGDTKKDHYHHQQQQQPKQQQQTNEIKSSTTGSLWSILGNSTGSSLASAKDSTLSMLSTSKKNQDTFISSGGGISALSKGKNTVANIFSHFKRNTEPNIIIGPSDSANQQASNNRGSTSSLNLVRVNQAYYDNNECNNSFNEDSSKKSTKDGASINNNNNLTNNISYRQEKLSQTTIMKTAQTQQTSSSSSSSSSILRSSSSASNDRLDATIGHTTMVTNDTTTTTLTLHQSNRFQVRYLGSSVLHKNFTLPMLEWIAKDIKRQTIRGAKTTSQRQITIPARDIILEIQSFQLKGSSCKDGHLIFVHPMQHVSKYAQLQHDPTCFSYLIRDYKDSPYTCHIFQAKSTKKVHDIFTAVREATTKSMVENQLTRNLSTSESQDGSSSPLILGTKQQPNLVAHQQSPGIQSNTTNQPDNKLASVPPQFENSYQFEVMFVKKVKLQCRRVPSTFVDDAMETLKSFEILKNTETKTTGLGKRIISVTVDERQEYDENCSSPTPNKTLDKDSNVSTNDEKNDTCEAVNDQKEDDQKKNESSSELRQKSDEQTEYQNNLSPRHDTKYGSTRSLNIITGSTDSDKSNTFEDSQSLTVNKIPLKQTFSMDSGSKKNDIFNQDQDEQKIQKSSSQSFVSTIYNNDFSPYNTITSVDLNNEIASMPVVSSSVSLDHETRQKLARQIREKIMESASRFDINKISMHKSSDKIDTSGTNKDGQSDTNQFSLPNRSSSSDLSILSSMMKTSADKQNEEKSEQSANKSNISNFDLFRRASTRQVVKNRTMLLLIGKDELCTISTDHHQVLFNKSFNCIVHCLQGTKNNDHFGLICRDSGKINPNTESYAGFIFKCQSDRVVREVMAAMKQVIHNSHHNFYSYDSPYNPLNVMSSNYKSLNNTPMSSPGTFATPNHPLAIQDGSNASNRFVSPNDSEQLQKYKESPTIGGGPQGAKNLQRTRPNPIRMMFCDDCPLHWYHRLCCDLESLPAETTKAIILRRLDTSFSDLEQDEVLSKFSEFRIESLDEHNDIFMSLLRHLCEKKQSKHNQSQSHITALANYNSKVHDCTPQHNEQAVSLSAMDNLLKAKKSISASIENILKRRSSFKDELDEQQGDNQSQKQASPNSLGTLQRASHQGSSDDKSSININISQRRNDNHHHQLSTESSAGSPPIARQAANFGLANITKINDDYNPLAGLFRRRSSTFGSNSSDLHSPANQDTIEQEKQQKLSDSSPPTETNNINNNNNISGINSNRSSSLKHAKSETRLSPLSLSPSAHQIGQSNHNNNHHQQSDSGSSSSLLTSSFWKKSIYEKIRSTMIPTDNNNTVAARRPTTSTNNERTPEKKPAIYSSCSSLTSSCNTVDQGLNIVTGKASNVCDKPSSCSSSSSSPKLRRSSDEIRFLWRKAIDDQITLIKMDKQNKILQAKVNEKSDQKIKLNYTDLSVSKEANTLWERLLMQDPTIKVDFAQIKALVRKGVSHNRRGEVWMFLMNQYQLRHGNTFHTSDKDFTDDLNQPYRALLAQLSVQQREIFVDLGRTFPNHPYYSQFLGAGQLSLFNLLKAYSLLDPQVGYCQGLSFVAGILLLHVNSEDEAFELMRHLLFNYGLRKQYLPSMNALQMQLYQLTRLLRDFEYDIFLHFDKHDISPSLYAAPWFLTLFASQFPLCFIARLLDLLFLHGIEAIFRVSINLLSYHRKNLLQCSSLESTMKYIKSYLMNIKNDDMAILFDKSMEMDLRNNLIDYEIEYTFYCAHDRIDINN